MAWGGQNNSMRSGLARAMKPKAGAGSATTPAYQQSITAAFAKLPGANTGAAGDAGGPPAASGLPVDPAYDQTIGGLTKSRDDRLAALTQQRTGSLTDFGYNATYDDKGNATALAFDPNNPYSKAALARKHYQQAKTGTQNSMAARGQLYSGALLNAQDTNDTGFAVNEDSRQKALLRFLAGNLSAQGSAKTGYETAAARAYGDRVGRAPKSPLYNPATGSEPAPAAPASTPTAASAPAPRLTGSQTSAAYKARIAAAFAKVPGAKVPGR